LQQLFAMLLLGIPFLFMSRPWQCRSCGHVWADEGKDEAA